MKIAIDITAITSARGNFGDKSGVYRYTLNLIKGIISQKNKLDKIYLLDFVGIGELLLPSEILEIINNKDIVFKSFIKPLFFHFKKTRIGKIRYFRWCFKKIDKYVLDKIYEQIGWNIYTKEINNYLKKEKINIIHFSDTVYFPTKIKTTLTIHDLVPFIFPELQRQETIEIHERKLCFAKNHSDGVICVSKNTQNDFIKLCPKTKNSVIYEGSDSSFYKIKKEKFTEIIKKTDSKTLNSLSWKGYYINYGTIEPRKNIGTLLSAYSSLYFSNKINKKLIIVGGNGWGGSYEKIQNFIKENFLENQILLLNFVSDEILNTLLNGAYSLIYPSFYEGFGLPPLEAMSLGIPTITSNTSSLPEVVGANSLTFNPSNINELKENILKIENEKEWKKYSEYGIERSKKFSWNITGKETLNFYKNIINESL